MYQFRQDCNIRLSGDLNFIRASANLALATLEKILLINQHHQLIFDLEVWDVLNPPSVSQLEQLSTRHPYQPVSGALIKKVEGCRDLIHNQLISVIKRQQSDGECNADMEIDDDTSQPNRPSRYVYPHHEKYYRIENNLLSNVMGGKLRGESNAREFKTCINEYLAFQINSEAKFTKVYREGGKKCFLMPAEFKDDAMRNFFRVKFEEFCDSSARFMRSGDDHSENLFSSRRRSIC